MIDIGNRIKELRKQRNLSAKELAGALDVSQSFISSIESNAKKCSLETLDKICETLGITLAEFFTENKPNFDPDLIQLLAVAKKLTTEERQKLTELLLTIIQVRNINE